MEDPPVPCKFPLVSHLILMILLANLEFPKPFWTEEQVKQFFAEWKGGDYQQKFSKFSGADLFVLSKEDCMQLAGSMGVVLYNQLHSGKHHYSQTHNSRTTANTLVIAGIQNYGKNEEEG